ncbi:MAG TPA: OmpH family outer membrane protein [Chitinophagaceae bacterium]|nr:OmpH family outer membrane protein [Chitinophagaceae bacterium]
MRFNRTNLLLVLLTLSVAYLLANNFFFSRSRIAYVDSTKLLGSYQAMTDARQEFEKKTKTWQANIDTLMQDVQRSIREYERTAATGTAKERELAKQLISTKQKELGEYQRAIQQNAQQEEARLNQEVISQVNAYLTKYGEDHRYKIILIAANGNIAYADKAMDITDVVVAELNRDYAVTRKNSK